MRSLGSRLVVVRVVVGDNEGGGVHVDVGGGAAATSASVLDNLCCSCCV